MVFYYYYSCSRCVEYLSQDSENNYSEADIRNLAKEQWLLNNLKDICPGSLPNDLKNVRKIVLNGKFVLQINAAFDIGIYTDLFNSLFIITFRNKVYLFFPSCFLKSEKKY